MGLSSEVSAKTDLTAPTLDSADFSTEDEVSPSWTRSDSGNNTGDFKILRSTDGSNYQVVASVALGTTTYTDSGVPDGTKFWYKIRRQTEDASADSNSLNGTTVFPGPSAVSVTADQSNIFFGELEVSYTDNSDSENGFRLQISTDGGSTWSTVETVGANQTTIITTEDDFTPDTTFDVRVQAHTDDDTANSSSVSVDTTITTFNGFWARLVKDRDTSVVLQNEIGSGDFVREWGGRSDWRLTIPYDETYESWGFSQLYLYYDDTFVFRGRLDREVESNENLNQTILSGYDRLDRLRRRTPDSPVTYTTEAAETAIQDYLDNHSTIGGSVTTPSVSVVSDITLQEADTEAEFNSLKNWADTKAVIVDGAKFRMAQTAYHIEGEDGDLGTSSSVVSDSSFSGTEAANLVDLASDWSGETAETEYTIPAGNVGLAFRGQDGSSLNFNVKIDGEVIDSFTGIGGTLGWHQATGGLSTDLQPGTHTISFEVTDQSTGDLDLDLVVLYDDRFSYNFDNTTDGDGDLDGPELHPPGAAASEVELVAANTKYNITQVHIITTWNDTTDNQRMGWSIDGGSTWNDTDNTSEINDNNTTDSQEVIVRMRFGGTGSAGSSTPVDGRIAQEVTDYDLEIDGNTKAVFDDITLDRNHLKNLQKMHKEAGMRFVLEHAVGGGTILSFRSGDETGSNTWDVLNTIRYVNFEGYANQLTGHGATKSGTRLETTITDDAEVDSSDTPDNPVPDEFTDVSIDTQDGLDSVVRSRLDQQIDQLDLRGTQEIVPENVTPGKAYPVSEFGSGDFPLERVTFTIREGSGRLEFKRPRTIGRKLAEGASETDDTKDAL